MNIEKWENHMSVNLNLEERQKALFLKEKMFENKQYSTIKCSIEF